MTKRAIVFIAAVLWCSVAGMAANRTRDPNVTGEGIWWREVAKGKTTAVSPPGPHMILTVPVSLTDVPAGVDSYKINCVVGWLPETGLVTFLAKDRRWSTEFGTGVATGNLSASTGNTKTANVEAKVGIFLVPVGQEIEIVDPSTKGASPATEWRRVKAVDAADAYQCVLYLFSGSWGESVRYLDPDAASSKDPLPYQNGESAFPILAGAKYQRVVTGRFLPAK